MRTREDAWRQVRIHAALVAVALAGLILTAGPVGGQVATEEEMEEIATLTESGDPAVPNPETALPAEVKTETQVQAEEGAQEGDVGRALEGDKEDPVKEAREALYEASRALEEARKAVEMAQKSVEEAHPRRAELSQRELTICEEIGLDPDLISHLEAKPIYEFTEFELHHYLPFVQRKLPNLRERIAYLGRKNIDQPYDIYLLGETPFEPFDAQPIYDISHSDCVVFSEHTYAMALSRDWNSFMRMLQRIRFKDGRIGVDSRNHYTIAMWDRNNSWLVRDITEELGAEKVVPIKQTIKMSNFLKNRYGMEREIEPMEVVDSFIPWEEALKVADKLQDGDFVNVIRGKSGGYWAGHVGLIVRGEDGTVNLLHSAQPAVKEQPLEEYARRSADLNERKKEDGDALFYGFKFFRLHDDPMANLRAIDGSEAPRIQLPEDNWLGLRSPGG